MANRPTFIDLRSKSIDNSSRLGVRSPRIQHFDGEVPPALSPLDAFAAQGRLLAKQLDDTKKSNRRVSRLPPATVTKSLSQSRPSYFRSASSREDSLDGDNASTKDGEAGNTTEVEEPKIRPKSEHPRISGLPSLDSDEDGDTFTTLMEVSDVFGMHQTSQPSDYFGAPRAAASPEQVSLHRTSLERDDPKRLSSGHQTEHEPVDSQGGFWAETTNSTPHAVTTLAPTTSPHLRQTNHIKSAHTESSDDDYTSSNAGSTFSSHPRKLSSSSGVSMPHSPISPSVPHHPRSPSQSSQLSAGGTHMPRPQFNFSRPLSSASSITRLSVDSPPRQQSGDSQPPFSIVESRPTPIIFDADDQFQSSEKFLSGAPTYIYAKFSLPRGRMVSRDSIVFSGLQTPHFEWQQPLFPSTSPPTSDADRSMKTLSPRPFLNDPTSSSPEFSFNIQEPTNRAPEEFSFGFTDSHRKALGGKRSPEPPSVELPRTQSPHQTLDQSMSSHSPNQSPRKSTSSHSPQESAEHGDLRSIRAPPTPSPEQDDTKSASGHSGSTIRPRSSRTGTTTYSYLSPDDHVTKGIACHENGSLKESTYHLRIAAMQNHPTAMLLYALACRHGWGMRPNQREGVQWLRKAVDSAVLGVADDEDPTSQNRANDYGERKARRAQFALSIYELGVSHLNGWGIEQDKALALRCFEIAGNWGDTDALAEAGFCYAEGVGCKKDLKKAAKFYRMAESRGMSMVGNSWIYKDKYLDDADPSKENQTKPPTPEKKPRNKSRTRSLFGRKKSILTSN